jgi:hypothetical protein
MEVFMKRLLNSAFVGLLIVGGLFVSSALQAGESPRQKAANAKHAATLTKQLMNEEQKLEDLEANPKATEKQVKQQEKKVENLRQRATKWVNQKYKNFSEMNTPTKVLVATIGITATAMAADYALTGGAYTQYAWDQMAKGAQNIREYFFSPVEVNKVPGIKTLQDTVAEIWHGLGNVTYIPTSEKLSQIKKLGLEDRVFENRMPVNQLLNAVIFNPSISTMERKRVLTILLSDNQKALKDSFDYLVLSR